MPVAAREVVEFWQEAGPERWFGGGPAFDARCRERLLDPHVAASRGELADWGRTAEGALALVLLLDQIPRNVFRGSAHAYATDPLARAVARRAIDDGHDRKVDAALCTFFYLPFVHAEDLAEQQRAVALYRATGVAGADKWAVHHHAIIERFGRFPHRNRLFGRTSTPDELAWLDEGGFAG